MQSLFVAIFAKTSARVLLRFKTISALHHSLAPKPCGSLPWIERISWLCRCSGALSRLTRRHHASRILICLGLNWGPIRSHSQLGVLVAICTLAIEVIILFAVLQLIITIGARPIFLGCRCLLLLLLGVARAEMIQANHVIWMVHAVSIAQAALEVLTFLMIIRII